MRALEGGMEKRGLTVREALNSEDTNGEGRRRDGLNVLV